MFSLPRILKPGPLFAGLVMLASPIYLQAQDAVTQPCDRACMEGLVDDYLDALIANNPDAVPLADDGRRSLCGSDGGLSYGSAVKG